MIDAAEVAVGILGILSCSTKTYPHEYIILHSAYWGCPKLHQKFSWMRIYTLSIDYWIKNNDLWDLQWGSWH
jgi:hypothetical protein